MIFTKTKLVLAIVTATFTLASVMVSPQAMAVNKSKAKKVKKVKVKKAKRANVSESPAAVSTSVDNSANSALQAQVNELSAQVNALKNQPAQVAAPAPEVRTVKDDSKDNMVFFRGGWAHSNRDRNGVSISSNIISSNNGAVNSAVAGDRGDKNAWYFGAGLDFSVDDNLFGMMDKTEVLAEVMFEYKEFANKVKGNALANTSNVVVAGVAGGLGLPTTTNALGSARNVTISQFSLSASPKIKFMKGSAFRPWILPIGFSMDVISPPSESITVLQPGMVFGAGADYNLWKNIYVGVDARYHHALGHGVDRVNVNGFTAGGYLGLGF
jgi:opacity protein-like surface antigen